LPITVAIIGAGPLGRWLALAAARAGFRVLLEDVMPANLHHAQEFLRQQLSPAAPGQNTNRTDSAETLQAADQSRSVSGHGFSRADNSAKLSRALSPEEPVAFVSTIEEAVRNADLVIDCVPDELESKLEILWLLDRMAPPRTVLATPTTRLSIADLASCTYRPAKCIAIAAEPRALTGNPKAGPANPAAGPANLQDGIAAAPEILLRTIPQTAPETVVLLDHFWRQLGFTPVFALDPASENRPHN
jgi:3-hydroxybutyryl-CoA dehydrogenase